MIVFWIAVAGFVVAATVGALERYVPHLERFVPEHLRGEPDVD